MIAAIPAHDGAEFVIRQVVPPTLAALIYSAPRICLSCGAKTLPDGSLPCGH